VGLDHGELDSRPLAAEFQQQLRGEGPPSSGGQAQPEAPDHPGLEIMPRGKRQIGSGHGHPRSLEEQLAGPRQLDATRVALEQLNAELGLEPAHLRRKSWLGDPQALGGGGEASLLGDHDEIAKMAEAEFQSLSLRCHRPRQRRHFGSRSLFRVQRRDVGGECPPATLRIGLKEELPPRRDEVRRLAPRTERLGLAARLTCRLAVPSMKPVISRPPGR
jgi:hypothetical protein